MQQDSECKWFEFLRLSSEVHLWDYHLLCVPLIVGLICIRTREKKIQTKIVGPWFYKCLAQVPHAASLLPHLYRCVFPLRICHVHPLTCTRGSLYSLSLLAFWSIADIQVFFCLFGRFFFKCHQSCSYWWCKVTIF